MGSVVNASAESVSADFAADPEQWAKVFECYGKYAIRSRTRGFSYDQTHRFRPTKRVCRNDQRSKKQPVP